MSISAIQYRCVGHILKLMECFLVSGCVKPSREVARTNHHARSLAFSSLTVPKLSNYFSVRIAILRLHRPYRWSPSISSTEQLRRPIIFSKPFTTALWKLLVNCHSLLSLLTPISSFENPTAYICSSCQPPRAPKPSYKIAEILINPGTPYPLNNWVVSEDFESNYPSSLARLWLRFYLNTYYPSFHIIFSREILISFVWLHSVSCFFPLAFN